jgi:GNAT superfamily N-acetyltransferase
VIIRFALRSDYAQWLPLWQGYNQFYGRSGETVLPDDVIQCTWARFFDDTEPVYCLVAEDCDRLLGLAQYLFHRSTIAIEPICYLQDLFTAPQARGVGIGCKLIEAVYQQALLARASRVYWQTHQTNETAQKLYDRLADKSGFIVYRKMFEPPAG